MVAAAFISQVDDNYVKIQKALEIDGRAFLEMSETFDEERRYDVFCFVSIDDDRSVHSTVMVFGDKMCSQSSLNLTIDVCSLSSTVIYDKRLCTGVFKKKDLNASRPSEYPTQGGGGWKCRCTCIDLYDDTCVG